MDQIRACTSFNDINYRHWLRLLDAEIANINGDIDVAISHYEDALDHAENQEFTLDRGLICELYAQAMLQRHAQRPARRLFSEAENAYRRVSAFGKAEQVKSQIGRWLSHASRDVATVDVACQTGGPDSAISLGTRRITSRLVKLPTCKFTPTVPTLGFSQ